LIILTPVLLLSDTLVDSLEKRLAKVSGNDKIDLLNQLSKAYRQSYPDSCVYYGNIATTLAKKSNYRKGEVEAELYIAAGESYNTSPKKSMEKLNKILKESQEINFKEGIAFALRFIGILKAEMSDYKGSNQEYEKAIEIGKEINFVLMTMEEFKYRLNMLDKFILEFLEGPHEEIINKIQGLRQLIANRKR